MTYAERQRQGRRYSACIASSKREAERAAAWLEEQRALALSRKAAVLAASRAVLVARPYRGEVCP